MKEHFQQLLELQDKANDEEADWYRILLPVVSGVLAVMVSLKPEVDGCARYFLASGWVSLGLSILSLGALNYMRVSRAKRLRDAFREELRQSLDEGRALDSSVPILSGANRLFYILRPCLIVSLVTSVFSVVSFAVLDTL